MKKVIAFSLWGKTPKYTIGAIRNAELAQVLYPGWICRFYTGSSVPFTITGKLKEMPNVEVIQMPEAGDWTGMFWRFLAASDPEVSVMISRDTDSRLSLRERQAVDQWLESGKDFHIMRDHPYHQMQILGGMWGAKNGILHNMQKLIDEFKPVSEFGIDQEFLQKMVYSMVYFNSFVHDEYDFFDHETSHKFPTERINYEFVGDVFDADDVRNPEYYKILIPENYKLFLQQKHEQAISEAQERKLLKEQQEEFLKEKEEGE